MVVTEQLYINNELFNRTYSDSGKYVVGQNGVSYEEAYDPARYNRTYTEGEPIPHEDSDATAEEIVDILLGGLE